MRMIMLAGLLLAAFAVHAQVPAFQLRAWQGDSAAMMDLSQAFTFGDGVTANSDSAKKYIDLAARKGHPGAQYLYGSQMMAQTSDLKRYAAGVEWVKKAADAGLEDAQVKLSALHRSKGTFTPADKYHDLAKAYAYAEMAARQGHVASMRYCAESRLTGTGTTRSDSAAIAWIQKAVDKKDALATVRMGDFHLEGRIGGQPDAFKALAWYQKALALPNLNMDQRNQAELGYFRADRHLRQAHNAAMSAGGLVPAGAFQYQIRQE